MYAVHCTTVHNWVMIREAHYSAKPLVGVCNHISRDVIMFCILRTQVVAHPLVSAEVSNAFV